MVGDVGYRTQRAVLSLPVPKCIVHTKFAIGDVVYLLAFFFLIHVCTPLWLCVLYSVCPLHVMLETLARSRCYQLACSRLWFGCILWLWLEFVVEDKIQCFVFLEALYTSLSAHFQNIIPLTSPLQVISNLCGLLTPNNWRFKLLGLSELTS